MKEKQYRFLGLVALMLALPGSLHAYDFTLSRTSATQEELDSKIAAVRLVKICESQARDTYEECLDSGEPDCVADFRQEIAYCLGYDPVADICLKGHIQAQACIAEMSKTSQMMANIQKR